MNFKALCALGLIVSSCLFAQEEIPEPTLINGRPAEDGEFPAVVYISVGNSRCSATIIGPRYVLTAAHCGTTGSKASFQVNRTLYEGTILRSRLYPAQDHDVAVIQTSRDIEDVEYASVGGEAAVGREITLVGYGCTRPGGGGGNDGILRVGETTIIRFSNYDMVSYERGGAALCFGDSGGPAFIKVDDKYKLLGVNSKGNIRDTNYNLRTDIKETKDFFQRLVDLNDSYICGFNKDCDESTPPPPPPPPPGNECKAQFEDLGKCLGYL